jgi:hypothetical protein
MKPTEAVPPREARVSRSDALETSQAKYSGREMYAVKVGLHGEAVLVRVIFVRS